MFPAWLPLFALCIVPYAHGYAQAAGKVPAAACRATWRAVEPAKLQAELLLDFPTATSWHDKLVATGDPALQWNRERFAATREADLIGVGSWDTAGSVAILPAWVDRLVMYPRLASTSDGRLHVVYGTRVDSAKRNWTTPPDTLWHVVYDGVAWTAPEPLPNPSSRVFWWENISPSALVATDLSLDLAVPIRSGDSAAIALFHRDTSGRWTQRSLVTGGGIAAYVRLARFGRVLVVTWAGPDPSATEDRSSVFATRSNDDGLTWERPQRLMLGGKSSTYDHALLRGASGRAFLLWTQQPPTRGLPADSVAIALSADSGQTWSRIRALHVPKGFGGLRAVLSPLGPVVFYSERGTPGSRIALLHNGRWVQPEVRPASLPFSGMISAVKWPANSITVVGSAVKSLRLAQEKNAKERPVTRLFRVTLDCSS